MMTDFYNLDGDLLTALSTALDSGTSTTFSALVDCWTGYVLTGETVAGVTIEARRNGSGSWVNVVTSPIALDAYDGTQQNYQFRITAGTVTAVSRNLIRLLIRPA